MQTTPYHPGEIAIQDRYGDRARALGLARALLPRIPASAAGFLADQKLVVLGGRDEDGALWASVIFGPAGFLRPSAQGARLHVDLAFARARTAPDPVLAALRPGAEVGSLVIDLERRRRLRVNGTVGETQATGLVIEVARAYANCPKYIRRRTPRPGNGRPAKAAWQSGTTLGPAQRALIKRSDTFFIASSCPEGPVDVSHRGGPPGFVTLRDGVLRFADYPGNAMYNTLGNLGVNPRAGLVFVDFERRLQLHLSGAARLDLRDPDPAVTPGQTGRWVELPPERWIMGPIDTGAQWVAQEPSPFTPKGN